MSEYACPTCETSLSSESALRDHAWDAHGVCHHCGEGFPDREELYTHWLDGHRDSLSREDRKRAENKVGDRTVCPNCGERFSGLDALRSHAWDAHDACGHCGETFPGEEALFTHWIAVHEDDLSRKDRERARSAVGDLSFQDRLTHQGPVEALGGVTIGRRALLGAGGVGVVGALGAGVATGVIGGGGGGSGGIAGHASTANLDSQPVLGPPPGEGEATIVAFEDPSCPVCKRFEQSTYPELKSKLIDEGRLSFVYRGIPVVAPWGEAALLALEKVYRDDPSAFWPLKRFYYDQFSRFTADDVQEMTRQFVSAETDVDADAVATAMRRESTRDAVQTDVSAARNAGVGGTPTFYLFEDGAYRTKVVGAQSYEVFANALGF